MRAEDIEARIAEEGDELACVMLCGVQYYTGQWMPMERITRAAHAVGATCGFDLAHAVGNVPLQLHDWNIDFACWCGYKYLNGGPGCTAGAFVHERHAQRPDLPRLEGWWGHSASRRFLMEPDFDLMPGAEVGKPPMPPCSTWPPSSLRSGNSGRRGMDQLREKSLALTAFLERGLRTWAKPREPNWRSSPTSPEDRGCQLSVVAHGQGLALFDHSLRTGSSSMAGARCDPHGADSPLQPVCRRGRFPRHPRGRPAGDGGGAAMKSMRYVVIGIGKYGSASPPKWPAARPVFAIDNVEERVEQVADDVALAITMDSTDAKALKSQKLEEMDAAVVAIGENFEATVLTTLNLMDLGIPRVIVRASGSPKERILRKLGIQEILTPETEFASLVAERLEPQPARIPGASGRL